MTYVWQSLQGEEKRKTKTTALHMIALGVMESEL